MNTTPETLIVTVRPTGDGQAVIADIPGVDVEASATFSSWKVRIVIRDPEFQFTPGPGRIISGYQLESSGMKIGWFPIDPPVFVDPSATTLVLHGIDVTVSAA